MKPLILMIVVVLLGTTGFLVTKTTTELAPNEDQSGLFAIVNDPHYATANYTEMYTSQFYEMTDDVPGVEARFQFVGADGVNSAFAIWALKPWGERKQSQAEIKAVIQPRISKSAGVQAFVFAPPSLPGSGGGLPIQIVLQTTDSPEQVYEVAEKVKNEAMASGKFIIVQNSCPSPIRSHG